MESKTHWKKLTNPNYLGAYSLDPGKDLTVKITKVVREMVKGSDGKEDECTVAHMEACKPMILNATNCKMISKIYDTSYIEDWSGKSITVYAAKVKAFGEYLEALRVRPKKPSDSLPELNPAHTKWDGAKQSIQSGAVTMDQIRKKYSITPENQTLLCSR